jgi:ribose transport system substrate-binding protein
MRTGRCWVAALGLALTTAACAEEQLPLENEPTSEIASIKRTRTPNTKFTPVELEQTVDSLVARINQSGLKPIQMVVLLKHISTFFEPIATGASRAMGELEAVGNVLGPSAQMAVVNGAESQALQNQQIANAIEDGAQGIAVSPYDTLNEPSINDAAGKGLHVVTFDTDLKDSKRTLYVGAIPYDAGVRAAETLVKMMPKPPGTVIIHGETGTQWFDGVQRTYGVMDVLGAAGYTVDRAQAVFINDQEGADVETMRGKIENADPPAVGMIGVFNISYRCAMAAELANKDIPIVAFDFDQKTVDYLKTGRIKATVVQRQYYEGYLVPYILYGIQHLGLEATKEILDPLMVDGNLVDIGLDVVEWDHFTEYNDFLDKIGSIQ